MSNPQKMARWLVLRSADRCKYRLGAQATVHRPANDDVEWIRKLNGSDWVGISGGIGCGARGVLPWLHRALADEQAFFGESRVRRMVSWFFTGAAATGAIFVFQFLCRNIWTSHRKLISSSTGAILKRPNKLASKNTCHVLYHFMP
jgi:hypothetical protein